MNPEERKAKTESFLHERGIPVNPKLPPLEDDEEKSLRSAYAVAKRILILVYLNVLAEGGKRMEISSFLMQNTIWNDVSPEERKLLKKVRLSRQDKIDLSWNAEAVWLMLWAIQKVPKLGFPSGECEPADILSMIPGYLESPDRFLETTVLRPYSQLLDMQDQIYRMHWAVREAQSKQEAMPAGIVEGVVHERHYAINWIMASDEDWDEVYVDT